jgi:KUP system potassium uptake protein
VFLTATPTTVPRALLSNLKHNAFLHERVVFVWVQTLDVPRVPVAEKVAVEHLGVGAWRVTLRCGFLDEPDVPTALTLAAAGGLAIDPAEVSYFVGRDTILPHAGPPMALWRKKIFATMHWNAGSSADFFRLPSDQVIEVGSQIVV